MLGLLFEYLNNNFVYIIVFIFLIKRKRNYNNYMQNVVVQLIVIKKII